MALSHLDSMRRRVEGERDEGGDREAADRQQPLRDAREAERRQGVPERLVERQVRAEREQAGDERRESEAEREPALSPRASTVPTTARSGVSQPTKTSSSIPAPTPRVKKSESSAE